MKGFAMVFHLLLVVMTWMMIAAGSDLLQQLEDILESDHLMLFEQRTRWRLGITDEDQCMLLLNFPM
ncbi:hypothetical protein AAHE18_10G245700 [Arachis hypogaea]